MTVVHRFEDCLDYSNTLSDEPIWVEFYKRIWPTLIACVRIDGRSRFQQWGIDREVKLPNGKQYTIDEKKRQKDYGDLCLELWSVWYGRKDHRNKRGWTCDPDKRCDFIAYAVVPARRCYLLPTEVLRLSFEHNFRDWLKSPRCRIHDAQNDGYITRNICVPWDLLAPALTREMTRDFASTLTLPTPIITNGDQLEFAWS
jgi:hypothetical protein